MVLYSRNQRNFPFEKKNQLSGVPSRQNLYQLSKNTLGVEAHRNSLQSDSRGFLDLLKSVLAGEIDDLQNKFILFFLKFLKKLFCRLYPVRDPCLNFFNDSMPFLISFRLTDQQTNGPRD